MNAMPLSRSRLVAASLGLILVLVVGLAVLAQSRATYHRRIAARVLHDYAQLAAEEYARRAQQRLAVGLNPALQVLGRSGAERGVLPDTASLMRHAGNRERDLLGRAAGFVSLAGGRVESTPGVPAWARDTFPAHARAAYDKDWYFAVVWGPASHVLVYTARLAAVGVQAAWGMVLPADAVRDALREAVGPTPLLPPSLTGGEPLDSLTSVLVRDPAGDVLFRTDAQYSPQYRAERTLGGPFGGIVAEVVLRPSTAPRLVIGGVPPSPLPAVAGMLVLTAILAAVAIHQLRQEDRLARLRTDFVAAASHELRTPLAQIRLFAETLQLGRVRSEDERAQALAIIGQESRRLSHLVDNLLHVARADRGGLRVAPVGLRLDEVAREVVDAFAPLAASRRASLRLDGEGPVWAVADLGAVNQVLLNLLDNAVKYGPLGGTVTIRVQSVAGETPRLARIAVDDDGPGIPASHRTQVFGRFERLDRDRDSAVGGSGIGLAIVRDLVTLMRGTVRIEDAPGGGTRVVVELPAA